MSTPIMMAFVLSVMFFQIGCGDKKDNKKVQAMVNACMFDPSGQCQQRAKAILENPRGQAQLAGLGIGTSNGTQLRKLADGKVAPVLPASIQAQAMKVQAALAADSNNPRSLHYDPAQPSQVVADRTPASTADQVIASGTGGAIAPASAAPAGGGGGEIVR